MLTPEQIAKGGSEDAHQAALFCWASLPEIKANFPMLEMMFAIPNGGYRDKREAGKFKATGVKAGVPDIMLAYPAGCYAGLFLEMKVGSNTPTPEQKEWIQRLSTLGYQCWVCYSWEQAKQKILDYLQQIS